MRWKWPPEEPRLKIAWLPTQMQDGTWVWFKYYWELITPTFTNPMARIKALRFSDLPPARPPR